MEGFREFQQWWSNRARLRAATAAERRRPVGSVAAAPPVDVELRIAELLVRHARQHVGMAVGVLRGDRSWFVGSGTAGPGRPSPPLADTTFEIGSVTKVFTATLLAALVEDGTVTLQDPVQEYLPAHVKLPVRGRPITLADRRATHTAGLPRLPHGFILRSLRLTGAIPRAATWFTVEDLYAGLPDTRLRRAPRGAPRYSNLGYGLLGHVLAVRVGRSYEELIAERICRPGLELADTVMEVPELARGRFAQGL